MSLTKQYVKSRSVCKVKFHFGTDEANGSDAVFVVGDFNGWNETVCPMKKQKDGSFAVQLELKAGREYQFRYLCDGVWHNDAQADRYEYCAFATADNSVIAV